MKNIEIKKMIFTLCRYSYRIIYIMFALYLILYIFILHEVSVYTTYVMILLSGLCLGYSISFQADRYLNNHNQNNISSTKKDKQVRNEKKKYFGVISVLLILFPANLIISNVFSKELHSWEYYMYFHVYEVLVLVLGIMFVVLNYTNGRK